MVGFPDIDFPNPAAEQAFRLGYGGSEDDILAFLRAAGGPSNGVSDDPRWVVMGALRAERLEVFRLFLNINYPIPDRENALLAAALMDWIDLAKLLLEEGALVDPIEHKRERTPLIIAARHGAIDMVRLLLRNGANVAARDSLDQSVLYHAAQCALMDVAECLLNAGADPNERQTEHGDTPLHAAARGFGTESIGEEHRSVISLLIKRGAETDFRNADGCTPLFCAALAGRVSVIDELLLHGASLNTVDGNQQSILHAAVTGNHFRTVECLLDRGLSTEVRNRFGSTPLHHAIYSPEVAKLLISRGADPNSRDNNGGTPLHAAANQGQISTINLLLMRGADPFLKNSAGLTAADAALENHHRDCAKVIWEYDYHHRQPNPPASSSDSQD